MCYWWGIINHRIYSLVQLDLSPHMTHEAIVDKGTRKGEKSREHMYKNQEETIECINPGSQELLCPFKCILQHCTRSWKNMERSRD